MRGGVSLLQKLTEFSPYLFIFFVLFNLMKLANTLPDKEMLEVICAALLEHMGSERQSFATILLALRTLLTLTEHNYGVYHQKTYVHPLFATLLFFVVSL